MLSDEVRGDFQESQQASHPQLKVPDVEKLVRAVQVAVGHGEAHEQAIGPKDLLKQRQNRERAALMAQDRFRPNASARAWRAARMPGESGGLR